MLHIYRIYLPILWCFCDEGFAYKLCNGTSINTKTAQDLLIIGDTTNGITSCIIIGWLLLVGASFFKVFRILGCPKWRGFPPQPCFAEAMCSLSQPRQTQIATHLPMLEGKSNICPNYFRTDRPTRWVKALQSHITAYNREVQLSSQHCYSYLTQQSEDQLLLTLAIHMRQECVCPMLCLYRYIKSQSWMVFRASELWLPYLFPLFSPFFPHLTVKWLAGWFWSLGLEYKRKAYIYLK